MELLFIVPSRTSSSLLLLLSQSLLLPPSLSLLLLLDSLRTLLFFFAGAFLALDSSSLLPRDSSASSCRLVVLAFSCCAPDVVDGMSLGDGLLTLCSSFSPSRECEDEIRRRLPCALTAGIRSKERLQWAQKVYAAAAEN